MPTTAVDHLAEPHHDTGPAYLLGNRAPGEELTARLWVPATRNPERIMLRQVVDGEPAVSLLERTSTTAAGSWWTGTVSLVNPINHYRFLLHCPQDPEPYLWCHAAGLSDHDVPDAADFKVTAQDPGPDWVRDAICYQVFPDRFAAHTRPEQRPAPPWAVRHRWLDEPPTGESGAATAWYGGDLDGITDHLGWIESLGADTVYLTPVFPAPSVHRYDATSFERVEESLGGLEALTRLSQALHARGMRLVLDLTTNHTGSSHEWFTAAVADPRAPEAAFYSFSRHPDRYACWFNVPSLPKLDHRSESLRDRLLRGPDSVTARWLLPPVSADGWRVDVGNMTGRHGQVDLAHRVAQDMRATMGEIERSTGRSLWLVAEHGHDASGDLTGPGWHGAMNYAGFTCPVWAWLSDPDPADRLTWLALPTPIPHLSGSAVVQGVREYTAQVPGASLARSMNLLCSHDTPRVRTVVGSRAAQLVAATALFTAPGVPTIFAGDELGATGRTGESSRTTIPWLTNGDGAPVDEVGPTGSWGTVDREVLTRYRHLAALRRELPALRRGGLRWIHSGTDVVAWLRTHPAGDVLVILARDGSDELRLPLAALPARGAARLECFDGVRARLEGGGENVDLVVEATGMGAVVAVLQPPIVAEHMG